jgi:hypothetical protein
MADKVNSVVSLSQPVTMVFPYLYEARAFGPKGKESGTPKYSANFLFEADSADLKRLVAKAKEIASSKWPGRDLASLKFPFSKGDALADKAKAKGKDGEFQRGKVVVVARSKYEPRLAVLGDKGKPPIDLDGPARELHKSKFYSGVSVLAEFNFVAYDGVGANPDGITAYLNLILTLNTGTRIGGGASAAEVFKGYAGNVSAEDPTADDEIPY